MSDSGARRRLLGPSDVTPQPEQSSARDRIVDPHDALEEEVFGASLRPRSFEEYVGQERVVENLRIAIDAAKRRGEPLEHVLFYGPPGLGKTTLAGLIARELNANFRPTSGPTLEKPKDLVGILTSLERSDVFFVDEVHRLGRVVEEFLYPAMEDFQIDFVVDRGTYAKTLKLPLQHFTLVGATTRAGMLTAPLRERFGIVHHLDYYGVAELERIVRRSANVLGVPIDPERHIPSRRAAVEPRASPTGCCGEFATLPKFARTDTSPSPLPTRRCTARASTSRGSTGSIVPFCRRSSCSIAAAPRVLRRSRPRSPKTPRRSKTSSSRTC